MNIIGTLFSWPNGIVVGNLLASFMWVPIASLGIYLTRNRWMKRFVAFHHKHKMLHDELLRGAADETSLAEARLYRPGNQP